MQFEYISIGTPKKLEVSIEDHPDFYFVAALSFPPPEFRLTMKKFQDVSYEGFDSSRRRLKENKHGWAFPKTARNIFRLNHLRGQKVYAPWDAPLLGIPSPRPELLPHQLLMFRHMVTRNFAYVQGDPGVGKSLAAITAAEHVLAKRPGQLWIVGPKAACEAFQREIRKWNSHLQPQFFTYDVLAKHIATGPQTPSVIIFDESQKLKTPEAQRTKAAMYAANAVRKEGAAVFLLSGTPAPYAPTDWWSQIEITWPGFLAEGSFEQFEQSIAASAPTKLPSGTIITQRLGWLDHEQKCRHCAKMEAEHPQVIAPTTFTPEILGDNIKPVSIPANARMCRIAPTGLYTPAGRNEVNHIYQRLKGLVVVVRKSDCLSLPPKVYDVIRVRPTVDMIQASNLLKTHAKSAAVLMQKTRALSDGFGYVEQETDEPVKCEHCQGTGRVKVFQAVEDTQSPNTDNDTSETAQLGECPTCEGTGFTCRVKRGVREFPTPKDDALRDLLDEYEDVGRVVVWGAFTGTIDKLVKLLHEKGWSTLRIDGQGWIATHADGTEFPKSLALDEMDGSTKARTIAKLAVVGNPQAGGVALTFTAAPVAIYYSNPFNGEARMQSEDRIHRLGCNGARIVDILCLPIDRVVMENLQKKKDLQELTLQDLKRQLEDANQ